MELYLKIEEDFNFEFSKEATEDLTYDIFETLNDLSSELLDIEDKRRFVGKLNQEINRIWSDYDIPYLITELNKQELDESVLDYEDEHTLDNQASKNTSMLKDMIQTVNQELSKDLNSYLQLMEGIDEDFKKRKIENLKKQNQKLRIRWNDDLRKLLNDLNKFLIL